MADPLSISASIAGLITVADSVFCRTFKYVRNVKNAPNEISRLSSEIGVLYGILNSLRLVACQLEGEAFDSTIQVHHVHFCHVTLEKVKDLLDKHETASVPGRATEGVSRRLKWPFSTSEARDLIAEVERHKSTLSLALTVDGMSGLLRALSRQAEVQNGIDEIKTHLQQRREAETRVTIGEEHLEVLRAIGPIDSQRSHEMSLKLRHPGTGIWLTTSDEMELWMNEPNARLWLYGIPGAGKTVLCSSLIQEVLKQSSPNVAVAFVYCDYKDAATQDPSKILGALASQIAKQDEQSFDKLRVFYQTSKSRPSTGYDPGELRDLVVDMASNYDCTMVIVDGLDECGTNSRTVVELIASLQANERKVNIKTLLLSRDEQDIREVLEDYPKISIAARSSDLRLYVGAEIDLRIRKRRLRLKDESLKGHIMDRLVAGADGMFRWVACQMDFLCELPTDSARRKALGALPPTLNATYERILKRVNEANTCVQRMVQRALRWIIYSHEPLTLAGLCEAVSIETSAQVLDHDAIPAGDEILRWCSSLVRRSAAVNYLELAHFTVKEFLTGIDKEMSNEFGPYRIDKDQDDPELGAICLTRMSLGGDYVDGNASFLLLYSARNWLAHSRPYLKDARIFSALQRFMGPSNPDMLKAWVRDSLLYDHEADDVRMGSTSALHFASMLALPGICQWLIECGCDVNMMSDFGTPLHCALLGLTALGSCSAFEYRDAIGLSADAGGDVPVGLKLQRATTQTLLDAGADPNGRYCVNDHDLIPLYFAAYQLDSFACTELLRKGAMLDEQTMKFFDSSMGVHEVAYDILNTISREHFQEDHFAHLLELALQARSCDTKELLELRSVPALNNETSFADYSASLRTAAQRGQVSIIRQLLNMQQNALHSVDSRNGFTALHYAARYGQVEVLKLLLEWGAACDVVDYNGRTPLHCSVRVGSESLAVLLQHQASIDAKDRTGHTVVHLAAQQNNLQALGVIRDLVTNYKLQANFATTNNPSSSNTPSTVGLQTRTLPHDFYNMRSVDGSTPLHTAVEAGSLAAIRFLLQNGSDPTAVKADGSNALHCAVNGTKDDLNVDIVDELLGAGVNGCLSRVDGATPVHALIMGVSCPLAESQNRETILRRLVQTTNTSAQGDRDGMTALHLICQISREQCNSSCSGRHGETKYHWNQSALEILLEAGGDLSALDRWSRTPLNILSNFWKEEFQFFIRKVNNDGVCTSLDVCNIMMSTITKFISHDQALKDLGIDPDLLVVSLQAPQDELAHKLLEFSPDVDARARKVSNFTPVEAACYYGCNHNLLMKFLSRSKALSDIYGLGSKVLLAACQSRHATSSSLVAQLLEAGLDPNSRFDGGLTAFMVAVKTNNADLMETLLTHGANPHIRDNQGWSVVHHACGFGDETTLSVLQRLGLDWNLKVGAKVGSLRLQGVMALHFAACCKDHRVLEYILNNDYVTDIDCTTDRGETALFLASYMGYTKNVILLLNRDADKVISPISGLSSGWSPLHVAAAGGHEDIVALLMNGGYDVQIRDKLGLTPELLARKFGHFGVAEVLAGTATETDYSDSDARVTDIRPTARPRGPSEPLRVSIETKDPDLCRQIVKGGADIDSGYPSCHGCSPLLYALHLRQVEIAEYLVERGASVAGETCAKFATQGYTAFHHAASLGSAQLLELLLQRHPRKIWQLNSAIHPIHLAVANGHAECSRLILSHIDGSQYRSTQARQGKDVSADLPNLLVRGYQIEWLWYLAPDLVFPAKFTVHCAGPLHIAAHYGDKRIARMLLDHGSLVDCVDAGHRTALHYAASEGHRNVIELLLHRGANPNCLDAWLQSSLTLAAQKRQTSCLHTLVQAGTDIGAHDVWGISVLQRAVGHPFAFSNLQPLLNVMSSSELGSQDDSGRSALDEFFSWADPPQIMAMLNFAPDPGVYNPHMSNILTSFCQNPLAIASTLRKMLRRLPSGIIPALIAHRAVGGGTPLYAASTIARPHLQEDFIDILMSADAQLELEGGDHGTPLMGACAAGRISVVKILVSKGAKICYTKGGETTSALRAAKHFPDIQRWLVLERFKEGPGLLSGIDGG